MQKKISCNCEPLRVAVLCNGLFPYQIGGMQKHTVELIRNAVFNKVVIDLYYIQSKCFPEKEDIHKNIFQQCPNVELYPVECLSLPYFPGHHYPESFWKSRAFLKALLKVHNRPDFIYAQGYMGWASIAYRKKHPEALAPIGVNFHGLEALQDPQDIFTLIKNSLAPVWLKWNLRNVDYVLSLGGTLDQLIVNAGVHRKKIFHSHNGVGIKWQKLISVAQKHNDRVKFLFVGRDRTRKGIVELHQVIKKLIAEPWFEMHFVGDISSDRQINTEQITYHGSIDDEEHLRSIYRTCDVLVCPSHSEGMPTVILEAMATGLPVIATNVGAVSLLVDDSNGCLIPAKDVDALESAIRSVYSADREALSRESLRRVKSFRWNVVAKNTVETIRFIVGNEHNRSDG